MSTLKRTTLAIVAVIGTGLVIRHHVHAPAQLTVEDIRNQQHAVDFIAYRDLAGWRAHHSTVSCELSIAAHQTALMRLRDRWGHPFVATCERGQAVVTSRGPDGVLGTDDDIASNRVK